MSVMSPRAMRTIRRNVDRWMVDVIEIWRGSTSEYDSDSLVESHVPGSKIYEGRARVRPTNGPREQAVAEGVIVMRDADFVIPPSAPLPRRDDEVRVKKSYDPEAIGLWFRITDVRVFTQQAARRFSGIQAQPSRQWPLEDTDE